MYSRSSLILALLGVGAGLVLIISVSTIVSTRDAGAVSGWSISAKELRVSDSGYRAAFQPGKKDTSWNAKDHYNQLNPNVRLAPDEMRIIYRNSNTHWASGLHDYTVKHLDLAQATAGKFQLPIGDQGEVELMMVAGMDWSRDNYDWPTRNYHEVDPVFYSPSGALYDQKQLEAMGDFWKSSKPHFRGMFPVYAFYVRVNGLPEDEYSLMGMHVWDAQTHYPVHEGGYSSSGRTSGQYVISRNVGIWRKTPVDLMFDFAIGPVEVKELSLDDMGEFVETVHGGFAVVGVAVGSRGNWNTTGQNRMTEMSVKLNPDIRKSSVVALVQVSRSGKEPLVLEALDHQGNILKTYSQGSTGDVNLYRVEGDKDDIAGFRVKTLTRHVRLIYSLPYLPGYPEENENVDDLLDQKIPYLYVHDFNEFQRSIEKMTQTRTSMNYSIASSASHRLQNEYKNFTVKQLLMTWNAITPNSGVMVNPGAFEIDLTASDGGLIKMLDQIF